MILDIDNSESVQAVVNKLTEYWFNPDKMYSDLKANGKTNSPDFWGITDHMIDNISEDLNQTPEEFLNIWNQKCVTCSVKIIGHHCTRHSNKEVFTGKGILPLSDETIKIHRNQNMEAERMWEYRSQRSPGPWFLLSYKDAKNPNNHFCNNGPEILLACDGYQPNIEPAKSIPLRICEIITYTNFVMFGSIV